MSEMGLRPTSLTRLWATRDPLAALTVDPGSSCFFLCLEMPLIIAVGPSSRTQRPSLTRRGFSPQGRRGYSNRHGLIFILSVRVSPLLSGFVVDIGSSSEARWLKAYALERGHCGSVLYSSPLPWALAF